MCCIVNTERENNIGSPKMRNNFWFYNLFFRCKVPLLNFSVSLFFALGVIEMSLPKLFATHIAERNTEKKELTLFKRL